MAAAACKGAPVPTQSRRPQRHASHERPGPAATRASTGASSLRAPAPVGARPRSGPSRDASRRASPRAPRRRAGPGQQGGAQRPGVGSVAAPAFRARALPQNGGASQGPPASLPAAPTAVAAACAAASRGRLKSPGDGGVAAQDTSNRTHINRLSRTCSKNACFAAGVRRSGNTQIAMFQVIES